MKVSVYHEKVFKEYSLPNIDNIDHTVILDGAVFMLSKDKRLDFENADGVWYIKECRGLIKADGTPVNGRIRLEDKLSLMLNFTGGAVNILCADDKAELCPYKKLGLYSVKRFAVGSEPSSDLCYNYMGLVEGMHCMISLSSGQWTVTDKSSSGLYINGRRAGQQSFLRFGDRVNILGLKIVFLGDAIAVDASYGELVINHTAFDEYAFAPMLVKRPPAEEQDFNRSPRVTGHLYDEKIDIEAPPGAQGTKKTPLLQSIGPSFTMAIPMVLGCILAMYNSKKTGMGGGAFMYTGLITAVGSALLGAFWAFKNLRYSREEEYALERKRFRTYSEYLVKTADEIEQKYANNYNTLNKMYPHAEQVCSYGFESNELWNRNFYHSDFLSHRVGLGEQPFQCEINAPKVKFSINYDSLQNKPEMIKDQFSTLYNVPVCIDIAHNNLYGIVGSKTHATALEVMYALAAQIAANNCYTDVKLVFIYDASNEDKSAKWEFLRWLPHVYSENKKVRFIAGDKTAAADVFFELANVIRKRLDDKQENKKGICRPHYVVFIEDHKLLDGEPIASYLLMPHNDYGVTTFILSDDYYKLPNSCENILQKDEHGPFIYNSLDTENERQLVTFDTVTAAQLAAFAKRIADIKVSQTENDSEIPASLSFMEMYGVSKLEDLRVAERWRKNRTYNTMKALVGKKAGGADCFLDIHEKYHGPHGLVAGTTGSGKSETLQTYIISLALNFSPDDVAFLIIDFKGGGMANLFDGLPHMAGTISNLSGNKITRAMVSIKSEIRRRQVLFSENSVNNINAYTSLYKAKEASIPIPHLLIVIDEFAEMKREEPEFMRELISVAQVGRSLGIHLILATQKPSGTVDDNIWSNTKFRLCLRVQSRSDSMDMLHKPDAAYLSQAGRCYLQVGSDEIFELFQSGWSGAEFDEDACDSEGSAVTMITLNGKAALIGNRAKVKRNEEKKRRWLTAICTDYLKALPEFESSISNMNAQTADEFVGYIIAKLRSEGFRYGDSEPERKALADFYRRYENEYSIDLVSENTEKILHSSVKIPEPKEVTQLDAIVDHLAVMSDKLDCKSSMMLWLPPLGEILYLDEIDGYSDVSYENCKWQHNGDRFTLETVVGVCDDPENQMQMPLTIDIARDGHHAVIGSVVGGKSTFMQTLLYSLTDRYSPQRLNMYVLDFSSNSLKPFEKAPHCGGFITEKELDRVGKLLNMINKMIEERKGLFNGGTYNQYVNAYGIKIPAVIIAIDNYASFSEKTEGKYEQFFNRLAREGVGYGIFLLISAQGFGINEIPNRLADNIGKVITISLNDKFKYMDVLRCSSVPLLPEPGVKGRGLVSVDDRLLEFQTAIAFKADDDYKRLELMKSRFEKMAADWHGDPAREIPSIPSEPVYSVFEANREAADALQQKELIPIAYVASDASVYSIDLASVYCFTVSGKRRTGKTNVLRLIMKGIINKKGSVVVFEKAPRSLR